MDEKTHDKVQIVFDRLKAGEAMLAALKEASEMAERHELLNMRQRNALLSAIASAEAAGIGDRP